MVDNPAFKGDIEPNYRTFPDSEVCGDPFNVTSRRRKKFETEQQSSQEGSDEVELQKSIGLFSSVGLLVGTIIGSGIFIAPKGVLQGTGSVGLTLIIWVTCGFFSFMGALSFAELGTLLPLTGGVYIYTLEAFAPERRQKKSFWGPLPAFLYSFQTCFFTRPAGYAVQGMATASYLMKLNSFACTNPSDETYQFNMRMIAMAIITTITIINCFSVNVATRFINLFMAAKVSALLCIIIGGFTRLAHGSNGALSTGFEGTTLSLTGLTTAAYSGLWAYAGWDNLNFVAKEIKDPEKNIIRALVVSIISVTLIYALTNVSYFTLLTKDEFLNSDAVAVDFATELAGLTGGLLMILSVVFSIVGSTTGSTFVAMRVNYAAAREGHLMSFLSFLNINYRTPLVSLVFMHVLSMLMIWSSDILSLIFLGGFLDSIFFSITMICFLIMRRTKKDAYRSIKVPLFAPLLTLTYTSFLAIAPFLDNPKIEYFYILIFLMVGVLLYTLLVYKEYKVYGINSLNKYIQIFFNVIPPQGSET